MNNQKDTNTTKETNETNDHKNNIIDEFKLLVSKAKVDKDKGWQFKVKNYQQVISILTIFPGEITSTKLALVQLRNGGMKLKNENENPPWKSRVLQKIEKIITEGSLGIEKDEKTVILELLVTIPEIGPSKAKTLYSEGIKSLEELENRKSELLNDKQLIGLRHFRDLGKKIPRDEMTIWGNSLKKLINTIAETNPKINVINMDLVGSYRRGKKESGDIDFYIAVKKNVRGFMKTIFTKLIEEGYMEERDKFSLGEKKMMGVAKLGDGNLARHLDIFIYPVEEYPFALLYATGCGEFNVKMRNYAIKLGYSLSDKSIRKGDNKGPKPDKSELLEKIGKEVIECEEDIFKFLGLQYIEPSNRLETVSF